MLFKRRKKKPILLHLRDMIWPRSGWKRSFLYIKHRILRLPHSTHDISMGLAAGCVVSWTPTWGIQILQCFVFCKIFRANFLASVLGTTFGNPWTFPILIWIAHLVGTAFVDITGLETYFELMGKDTVVAEDESYEMGAFLPTLIGGYIMAIVTFPLFYYSFYYMIKGARAARVKVTTKVHDIIDHRKEAKEEKESQDK